MLQNEMKNEHLDTSLINTSNSSTNSNSSSCVSSSSSMNFNNANGQQQQFNMVNCLNAKNNNDINNNSAIMLNNNTNNTPNGMIRSTSNTSLCGDHDISANFDDFSSQTNLIVNYLPQNMTQDEIKSLFANIGPVESCKLIKDKLSDIADGQSLGYAFVNYAKQEDAQKAIDSLNGMRLQNKTIKVSLARPSSESIKGANLYVCGLHKDFTQTELENMFTPFGTIISSKILTDPKTGASKGVGFVRFDQRNEAEIAIGKLNGSTLDSSPEPLVVKFANSPTSAKTVMGLPLAPFVPTVRGFYQPYRSSTNASYRYSPMGYCPETSLLQQHQAPPSHLTGMLPAQPHQQQQLHQQQSNTSLSNSLNCSIGALTPSLATLVPAINSGPPTSSLSNSSISSSNYSGWCIFVYNLGPETDEGILWQLFGPFGAVQSVKIIRDAQTQKCKGFGFVTMTNYDEAVLAINCLNGFNLQNRILQVSFKTNHKQIFQIYSNQSVFRNKTTNE